MIVPTAFDLARRTDYRLFHSWLPGRHLCGTLGGFRPEFTLPISYEGALVMEYYYEPDHLHRWGLKLAVNSFNEGKSV